MKKVLFVCYGGGHVRMVLPVARALQEAGLAQVQILGLTSAAPVVRQSGLELLQIKDFLRPSDAQAVAFGHELGADLGQVPDIDETAAYLGLSFADLVVAEGEAVAAARYAREGRQAFLPRALLTRVLSTVKPDLVVATSAPRAERAAILAAGDLGIPSVCMVDLFAVDEVRWLAAPAYANRLCVLNDDVKRFLLRAGRSENEVIVTGNPAFDALQSPQAKAAGEALRKKLHWQGKKVLLWPIQVEPSRHPFDGRSADPELPARVLAALCRWTLANEDVVLCVRPRDGEAVPDLPPDPRLVVTGQDWALPPLLHAIDMVVTLTSTVGLEGFLTGARVVQVLGSVFDEALPLWRFGMAQAAVPLNDMPAALDRWAPMARRPPVNGGIAVPRILDVLNEFI